ncbi:uncharacterized protein LOC8279851 isoform X2 [Ricinus communis]|nr:uncharacterized protein LOC8279851 isoform X2 [Ricinus communis]XP_048234749.1 uncharacterized protein LOC8279851 isoform X2 [Ricinus communis]|eukprot:XP_015582957.1 uncharacterized protein LOC8279851 [Ricinus communis]
MRNGSGVWRSLRDGDFEEEDVWDVLRDKKDSNSKIGNSIESSISVPRNLSSSAARMIPRATTSGSSSSSNNSSHGAQIVKQQSAPVNIPDWSKVCKKTSKKSSKKASDWRVTDDDDDDEDDDYHRAVKVVDTDDEDEYADGDNNYQLPPHELISRRLARSQISSFSVFEGVGRKLKGRDLSKVRNAVLIKTGFLESP